MSLVAARRLRLGVAGVGRMGSRHLGALLRRDDVTVSAVADPSGAARARATQQSVAGGRPPPQAFADAEEMLATEKLDGVVIATPPRLHAFHCLRALDAGVAVLVEKPLATTAEDGRLVVAATERGGGLAMVGHIERFNPAFSAMVELLRSLPFGRPTRIEAWRHGPPGRATDVGVALDLAVHDVDLVCHVLGDHPISVRAGLTSDAGSRNLLDGEMHFAAGAIATVSVGWDSDVRQRRMVVTCANGSLEIDFISQELRHCLSADEVWQVASWPGEPLVREHDAFLEAMRTGGPAPVSSRDGLRAVSLVCALVASARTGAPIAVDPSSRSGKQQDDDPLAPRALSRGEGEDTTAGDRRH